MHSFVDPEDAIQYADGVCVGEGEKAFLQFLNLFSKGHDYTHIGNFYFKNNGQIIRNALLPLQTSEELGSLPYPLLCDGELLFKAGRGFVPLEPLDYVCHEGLVYNTIWSIGCPNRCIYCANSKFLKNHRDYARLRFPPVDHIVDEVLHARKRYPHLSSVTFQDDMFIGIPLPVLEEFAEKWRDKVRLPFAVQGLMSRYVDPQKMKILISAGMIRVRMGIQSGSPRTRKFYRRHDSNGSIKNAIGVINSFSKYMITPSHDLIVDNPLETKEDISETIKLLYKMPRPFILNVFPLMIISGTELWELAKEKDLNLPSIKQGHPSYSYANILILAVCLLRLPEKVFEFLLKRIPNRGAGDQVFPITGRILSSLMTLKRALAHLRLGHFAVMPSKVAWILWKLKFVGLINRRILMRCRSVLDGPSADDARSWSENV